MEVDGDGSLVDGHTPDGKRACEEDPRVMVGAFLALVGTGRLENVLLLGMPPMGSSGRHI